MRIALAQLNPTSGDIDGNTAKVLDAIAEASARGADLLVTPEMAIPGYCIGDLVEDAGFLAANERAMPRVAAAATSLTAIVGFIDHDPSARTRAGPSSSTTPRPSSPGARRCSGRTSRCCRTIATSTTSATSRRRARATPSTSSSAARPIRLGVSICEDMWDEFYAVKPLPELAAKGADLLVNINASPFYPGKRHERDALIRQHVARLGKPFVYVNTSGAADNGKNIIPFDGESLVYAADGRLLAMGRQFAEELARRRSGCRHGRRLGAGAPAIDREREMYDALVMALRDYMRKTGFTRAVVAVSGGIDSALALAIAVDALGPDSVSAFNMPSQFNTETTRVDRGASSRARSASTTGSSRFRTSPITSSGCSRITRIRSRAASRARTCRPASEAS